ncbi:MULTISPECIES: hypothetical protein [Streptomyces]|uniref:hypothetical protein n=1 Tax=Streptomyces TaxID=1883 RepID=UPI00163BB21D|nr:hypothetical protein [Streptomyces sp. WAC05858]WTA80386.1 hypothetical protein OG751_10790 [Streptomyces antimycoticus]
MGAGDGVTLCDLRVFVDGAAESIASMDASVVGGDEWFGLGESVRRPLSKGSMRPVSVAVLRILADERRRWRSSMIRVRSVASRRHDPIQRSAIAFIRGTAGRVADPTPDTRQPGCCEPSVDEDPRQEFAKTIQQHMLQTLSGG